MQLKLELQPQNGALTAISVIAEATATVADVAAAIHAGQTGVPCASTDLSLQILDNANASLDVLPPQSLLPETNLRSGQRVRVVQWAESHRLAEPSVPLARLTIAAGPGAGKTFDLHKGPNIIGRQIGCEVVLEDPLASRKHARVIVGDQIEIVDMNSANGVVIADELVDHAIVGPKDIVAIGDTEISVQRTAAPSWSADQVDTEFNRSPLVRQRYEGRVFSAPKPPAKRPPAKLPWVAMVAPLLMGAVMYAMTQNLLSIIFVVRCGLSTPGCSLVGQAAPGVAAHQHRRWSLPQLGRFSVDGAGAAVERTWRVWLGPTQPCAARWRLSYPSRAAAFGALGWRR